MIKRLCLLILATLVALGGCTKKGGTSDPSSPTAMLVDIAHPDLVPEAVSASEAFTYARERADVILAGGNVVTGPDTITGVMGNIMSGAADSFTVASFYDDWWTLATYTGTYILLEESGETYRGGFDLAEPTDRFSHTHTVVNYSDYHYLTFAPDETFEPGSIQLVNGRDFIENFDDKERIRLRYIEPISPSAIGSDWTTDGFPEVDIIWLFEDLYRSHGRYAFDDYPNGHFPYDVVWETLHRYFPNLPESRVRTNRYYDAGEHAFIYEGGRGGLSPVFYVTDFSFGENWVTVDYTGYNYLTGVPEGEPRRLTASTGDAFYYMSNLPLN